MNIGSFIWRYPQLQVALFGKLGLIKRLRWKPATGTRFLGLRWRFRTPFAVSGKEAFSANGLVYATETLIHNLWEVKHAPTKNVGLCVNNGFYPDILPHQNDFSIDADTRSKIKRFFKT